MLSRRLAGTSIAVLLLGATGCGGGGEQIDPEEEAGVGTDAGMEVLVDTAATPVGGVPGAGTADTVTAEGTIVPGSPTDPSGEAGGGS